MEKISPLAENLINYIETRIISGEYPVGSKLPSVRRFAGKFGLSFGTAYRAIRALQEKGLLEQRGTAGLYIKSHRSFGSGNAGRVAVLITPAQQPTTGLFHSAYLGIEKAAVRHGYQLQVHYVGIDKISADKLKSIAAEVDGILLLCEYDAFLQDFPALPCPTVALLSANAWNGMVSTVNIDADDMARVAENYFLHRRLWLRGVKVYSSPKPIYISRALAFESRWRLRGGRCEVHIGYPDDRFPYDPEYGYFFTSDQWLQNAATDFLQSRGVPLTEQHTVLGVDGKQFLDPDFFRFPTISVNWPAMGEIMLDELARRRANPNTGARNISVCGKLRLPEQVESMPDESV